jgi:hypothetical protein
MRREHSTRRGLCPVGPRQGQRSYWCVREVGSEQCRSFPSFLDCLVELPESKTSGTEGSHAHAPTRLHLRYAPAQGASHATRVSFALSLLIRNERQKMKGPAPAYTFVSHRRGWVETRGGVYRSHKYPGLTCNPPGLLHCCTTCPPNNRGHMQMSTVATPTTWHARESVIQNAYTTRHSAVGVLHQLLHTTD